MGFYAKCKGSVKYKSKEDFEKVVKMLKNDGYINDDNMFTNSDDENGGGILGEGGGPRDCDEDLLTVNIPYSCYKNLTRVFEDLMRGGAGRIVWTSTDSCFAGGVFVNGVNEKTDELYEWAKKNGWKDGDIPNGWKDGDIPDDEDVENLDEWLTFMSSVEYLYHKRHSF